MNADDAIVVVLHRRGEAENVIGLVDAVMETGGKGWRQ